MKQLNNKTMKTLGSISVENQVREFATKIVGANHRASELFFVQMDDYYAVGSNGWIFQFLGQESKSSFFAQMEDGVEYIAYISESGNIYNYAEDSKNTLDEESLEIYNHCLQQAELNFDEKC